LFVGGVMSESKAVITYEPFKEIVIMERTGFKSPDEIARFTSVIAGGKLAGLYWADGVVFLYQMKTDCTIISILNMYLQL